MRLLETRAVTETKDPFRLDGEVALITGGRQFGPVSILSPRNALEFCIGTLAEMTEGSIYDVVEHYSRQGKLGYVHLRNVRDKVPHYKESFIDDGEVDVLRVLRILKRNSFNGVVIPDHAPQMACAAPWHAGMAYALGFLKAGMARIGG